MPVNKKNKRTNNKRLNKGRKTRKNQKPTVVIGKIYANWCAYCVQLKPLWDKMKSELRNKEKSNNCNFVFIEIESSQEEKGKSYVNERYLKKSPHKLDLQGGYPTLFKIIDGKLSYYDSSQRRELPQLITWSRQIK